MEADAFWHFIRSGWVPPWLSESRQQNEVVIDVISGAARRFAEGGYEVVVDGIVGPWFLDRFRGPLTEAEVAMRYVVLRPDATTALGRATSRGTDALTNPEPVERIYREFCELGRYEANVLDSTSLSPEQTVDEIRRRLQRGTFLLE